MSILILDKVTLRFGGLTALKDISLSIRSSEILSIIGPNGAGKTSLFNVITGMYEPTQGQVLLDGNLMREGFSFRIALRIIAAAFISGIMALLLINAQSLFQVGIVDLYIYQEPFAWKAGLSAVQSYIGGLPNLALWLPVLLGCLLGGLGTLVSWSRTRGSTEVVSRYGLSRTFQNIRLFNQLSTIENLLVAMDRFTQTTLLESALRLPRYFDERKKLEDSALDLLEFVGLKHRAYQRSQDLSYGDQRRLEIARALATKPRILLLDEPAAGMNPTESAALMELIRRIRDTGVTVILIEHHMKVVMGVSDRVVVLDYGSKIAEGSPAEVCANPKVIEAYLGKGDTQP